MAAGTLVARTFDSGFAHSRHSYNAVSVASDGRVYYVLSSQSIDVGAQMYRYDPAGERIEHLGDLTEACGEAGSKAIPQGKSHVRFAESGGKLYFATHLSYYAARDGRETKGEPPEGYQPYPGGHFLAYDMAAGTFEDLCLPAAEQGILAMAMDPARGRLYGMTWPNGFFLSYDLAAHHLNMAPVCGEGETGEGRAYRTICRALVVDPEDGSVYFTSAEGTILRYRPESNTLDAVAGDSLRKDYFGMYDPASPFHMSYHWRQAVWHPGERAIYGVHGNSGYLFRFDPRTERVDAMERLCPEPSRRSGMFDKFSHGYLGFALGPDDRTLYYLAGGVIYENGRPLLERTRQVGAQGVENLHLITFDTGTGACRDHGPVWLDTGERPAFVQSIGVAADGAVYALAAVGARTDLIRVGM